MTHKEYAFVIKEMYGDEYCYVEIFKTKADAFEAMMKEVNLEISTFARNYECAPVVKEYEEEDRFEIIFCDKEALMMFLGEGREIPRTDYRVIEVDVND